MRRLIIILAFSFVSASCVAKESGAKVLSKTSSASALVKATGSMVERGAIVYKQNCAACHSYGYGTDGRKLKPAVEALQIKYNGAVSAFLEERSDLNAAVLGVFIRNGIKSMTPFRKTEVSDYDIEAIAAYIAQSSKNVPVSNDKK